MKLDSTTERKIMRGDLHITAEVVSSDHPYQRGRLVVDRGVLRYTPPRRVWVEYPPVTRVDYTIPIPVIRCIERR